MLLSLNAEMLEAIAQMSCKQNVLLSRLSSACAVLATTCRPLLNRLLRAELQALRADVRSWRGPGSFYFVEEAWLEYNGWALTGADALLRFVGKVKSYSSIFLRYNGPDAPGKPVADLRWPIYSPEFFVFEASITYESAEKANTLLLHPEGGPITFHMEKYELATMLNPVDDDEVLLHSDRTGNDQSFPRWEIV